MRHLEVSETRLRVKVEWKTEAENEGSLHAFGIHRSCENPFDVWGRCSSSLMTFHRGTWVININMKMNDSAKWFSWLFNRLQHNVCAGGLHWPVTFHLNGTVIVMLYNMCRSLATTHLHKQTKGPFYKPITDNLLLILPSVCLPFLFQSRGLSAQHT